MKVLYCIPSFWEYRLPFYWELNRLFNGRFHVIYSTKRYRNHHASMLPKIIEVMGDNAHPYDNEPMYDAATRSFSGFTEGKKKFPLPIGLWKRIKKVKPDVLISEGFFQWMPWVLMYGLIHRIPVYMGYERTPWTERNCKAWLIKYRRFIDRFLSGYLVNGSETKKYLMSIGVKEEKIHIGGMSADSDGLRKGITEFQKETERFQRFQAKFKRNSGLIYLFTGFLIERKGILPLLDAWREHSLNHPDDSLVVVGNGNQYDQCIKEYGNLKSVFFEGRIPYTEIHKYYAIADVYVLPTIEDNWSLVIPEAMACGLPVATSIYNGCYPELVHEDENGYVFDTFKKETIVKALDYFHHVNLKAFGQRSIELEKEFNTENSAKREYEAIMKSFKK